MTSAPQDPLENTQAPPEPDQRAQNEKEAIRALLDEYWKTNLRLMAILLVIWAFVSLGCGVLFADWLNQFRLPGTGFPLGFWFAQQGSIIVFVILILVYCVKMNRLDDQHHRDVERLQREGRADR
jgi:putative solute:sodium symporter small subunit